MSYGVGWKQLGAMALVGSGVGAIGLFVGLVGCATEGRVTRWDAVVLPAVLLFFPLFAVLVVGACALLRLRVRKNSVELVLLGVFVIRRRPLARFVGARWGTVARARFEDGTAFPVVMVAEEDLARMEKELRAGAIIAKAAEQAGCDKPPRPVRVAPEWLAWQDGTVKHLAETLAAEQKLDQLGILADALEDAGCSDEVLLSHLRSAGPHVCGCWALNLILGKA